ncbi:Inhibitor of apoptosis-promoting Bax1-related protein [Dimargaris cristalligena]|uniref:Inhibitor of apoptosis-promoting Bax1-domain-containing protein n=1 Tax=Dimargaris cristalligena TaxID=215637 RepID=A0A4P9ZL30_9FUNG|nr:Inhibitor of apoptosis-promoting Bax1-related protein [Dimargaris cristalligena]RKP33778.1 inhibitor of apoptosis-promoting Bax1-domain-containing protein [Dimargaris cristalligena]|eukprot:RKP33778.1 inhibitor of apoptosis-promoting Bax1-domain-containing protein [Dimargaris cristalligena]
MATPYYTSSSSTAGPSWSAGGGSGEGARPTYSYSFETLTKTNPLSPLAQRHLTRVYTWLALASGSAALGSYAFITGYLQLPVWATLLLSLASVFYLSGPPAPSALWASPAQIRQTALLTVAFTQGNAIGSLLNVALYVDPRIVTTALAGTLAVFTCFTASAIFSRSRVGLYFGGLLGSALSVLALLSWVNGLFLRSEALFALQLYGGLAIFSFYIIYDTQKILHQIDMGYLDAAGQAFELYTDAFAVFVRLLIILLRKEENRERRRDNRKRS